MISARAYLAGVKATIALCPNITQWVVLREEAQGDVGMLRYRLTFDSSDLLEVFEYFRIVGDQVVRPKYSYHWQDSAGALKMRWDNAAHHPEVATYPHHLHQSSEAHVLPHGEVTLEEVLEVVTRQEEQAEKREGE